MAVMMGLLYPLARACVTTNCPINILCKFLAPSPELAADTRMHARLRHSPPDTGAGDITIVTETSSLSSWVVVRALRVMTSSILESCSGSDTREVSFCRSQNIISVFLKQNMFLVVALNEESNGDVNKNTENGGTKMMTDLNGSNNGRNPREIITNIQY